MLKKKKGDDQVMEPTYDESGITATSKKTYHTGASPTLVGKEIPEKNATPRPKRWGREKPGAMGQVCAQKQIVAEHKRQKYQQGGEQSAAKRRKTVNSMKAPMGAREK